MSDPAGYRDGEFVGRCDDIPTFDKAQYLQLANFMPKPWASDMLDWAQRHHELMVYHGGETAFESSSAMPELVEECPIASQLIDAIVAQAGLAAFECSVEVTPRDDVFVEAWLSHRGEGDHFHWHTDRDPGDDQTRLLSFCYYLHSRPCQFMGGEIEFFDGVQVAPEHNKLVFFHPFTIHRVRHVHAVPRGWGGTDPETGTAPGVWPDIELLHPDDGRWCVVGWVHSRQPDQRGY